MTKHAVVDLDAYKYAAAYVGEKKSIRVTHKTEDWSAEHKSRTAFYGHWKKKAGGWLAEANKERESPWLVDEFDIEDISVPEPIENVLHTAKAMVDGILYESGAESYEAYMGKGDSFRVELSTLLKYKGNRDNLVKPYHLDSVTEYLARKYNAEFITELEADDVCVISAYKDPNKFIIGEDKDYWGCGVNYLDINRMERGIVNCDKVGHLFIDSKNYVRGEGRIFLYYQMLSEDEVDNYKANCFSDMPWGSKSAYEALVNCTTDKECWQVLVDCFRKMYPEEKVITGWRGDEIKIDHMYVLQEMFNMAHMKRTYTEPLTDIRAVLDRMGIKYD